MINKQRSKAYQDALRKQRAVIRKLQEEVFALRAENERLKHKLNSPEKTAAQQRAEDMELAKAHQQIGKILASLGVPDEVLKTQRRWWSGVPKHEQESHDFEVDSAGKTTDYRYETHRRARQALRTNLVEKQK
jgi:predicted RNase H-like nuclease (RuvC/YqgF family)